MGSRQTRAAMTLLRAMFFATLLIAPSFPLLPDSLSPVAPAAAQSQGPWWGPVDGPDPKAEWHMRIALRVENPQRDPLTNPVVEVELDLARLLREAGWPTDGEDQRLSGFTLDEQSLRLVEYTPGWGSIKGDGTAIPVAFERGFREGDNPAYDPARNPQVTVTWVAKGTIEASAERSYFLYFDSLEAGLGKDALKARPEDLALVAARSFGGPAVEFYGRELGAPAGQGRWDVIGTAERTVVTVYDLSGGLPVPHVPTGSFQNPMMVNASERKEYAFPRDTPFKVVADKPILMGSRGKQLPATTLTGSANYGATSFIPSLDKGYAGRTFVIPAYAQRLHFINSGKTEARVTLTDTAGTGLTQTISVPSDGYASADVTVLEGGRPRVYRAQVTQGPDVLVQYGGSGGGLLQLPTIDGTPQGPVLTAYVPPESTLIVVSPDGDAPVRVLDAATNQQFLPEAGRIDRTKPQQVTAGLQRPWTLKTVSNPPANPVTVFSSNLIDAPTTPERGLVAFAGKGAPTGQFGAQDGRTFHLVGSFQAFAHYNGTDVLVTRYRDGRAADTATLTLDKDGSATDADLFGSADPNARYLLVAAKPASVVPVGASEAYGRFLTGRPAALPATAEGAEYRGALVSLRQVDQEELSKVTSLNRSVTYRFEVENRGRKHLGENLRDDLVLTHLIEARPGTTWRVAITPARATLDSLGRAAVVLTVTPEAGVEIGDEARVTLVATSSANPRVSASVGTNTLVQERRDVALSFIGGLCPLEEKRCQQSVDNGQPYRYEILLQNKGTVRDTLDVSRSDPGEGWIAEVEREGAPLREITLDPGEAVFVELVGTAPPRGNLIATSTVEVIAESRADPSKSAKVFATTRITQNLNVSIHAEDATLPIAPGGAAIFNITLENRGNDIFTFRFGLEGILPAGWAAGFTTASGEAIDEINLNPDDRFPLRLRMTAAPEAIMGDRYTQKLGVDVYSTGSTRVMATRQIILTAQVTQVHNLTVDTVGSLSMKPGPDATLSVLVRNGGNGPETVSIRAASVPPTWAGPRAPAAITIPAGGEETIPVRFSIPDATENGTYALRLLVVSADGTAVPLAKSVEILGTAALDLSGESRIVTAANTNRTLAFTLRNVGNMRLNATLTADAPSTGWVTAVNPPEAELRPGEAVTVTLAFMAPIGTPEGSHPLRLIATPRPRDLGTSASAQATVEIRRPDLVVVSAATSTGAGPTAGLTLVTATLRNDGDIEARGVTLGLYRGDRRIDNVTLALLAPGQSAVATLKVPTEEAGDLRIRIDTDDTVDERNEDNNGFGVSLEQKTPAAPLPLLLAGLAALALALHRRRRPA